MFLSLALLVAFGSGFEVAWGLFRSEGTSAQASNPSAFSQQPANVEIDLEGRPYLGSEDAPVTIVEFVDYGCPFCGQHAREMITLLRGYLNSPTVKRGDVREAMQRLRSPMTHTVVRELRDAYDEFQPNQNIVELLDYVRELVSPDGGSVNGSEDRQATLTKEDLHLVCFDYVWS